MPSAISSIPFIDLTDFGDGTSEVRRVRLELSPLCHGVLPPTLTRSRSSPPPPKAAREIGERFYQACRDVGFAYLVGHGVAEERIDEMFSQSKRFFSLPFEDKMKGASSRRPAPVDFSAALADLLPLARRQPNTRQRATSTAATLASASSRFRSCACACRPRASLLRGGPADPRALGSCLHRVFDPTELDKIRKTSPDHKESFDMGVEDSPHCANIWLEDEVLPGFRAYAVSFFNELDGLQVKVLRALALGMPGLDMHHFDDYHSEGDHQLRLLHCACHSSLPARLAFVADRPSPARLQTPRRPSRRSPAARRRASAPIPTLARVRSSCRTAPAASRSSRPTSRACSCPRRPSRTPSSSTAATCSRTGATVRRPLLCSGPRPLGLTHVRSLRHLSQTPLSRPSTASARPGSTPPT